MACVEDSRLGRQSAIDEARASYRMLGCDGNTVEGLRELIAVPPRVEWVLRAYAKAHPEEAHFIERVIKFGKAVAREFERFVRDGVPWLIAGTSRSAAGCFHHRGRFRVDVRQARRNLDSSR